jgi:hypothetical protein
MIDFSERVLLFNNEYQCTKLWVPGQIAMKLADIWNSKKLKDK